MTFYKDEKMAILIDGANFYGVTKTLDFEVDYKQMLHWAQEQSQLVRAYYLTTLLEDADFSPLRPLIDWLDYNGFTVVTKKAREFTDGYGNSKIKGTIDVDLTITALKIADSVDHIVLFTGDGTYTSLVAALQEKGVRVSVVSSLESSPPMISDELRRQADNFIEILDLIRQFERDDAGEDQELQQIING